MPSSSASVRLNLLDCLDTGRSWRGHIFREGESQLVFCDIDRDGTAFGKLAEKQLVGKRPGDLVLDETPQRTRAEARVMTAFGEPLAGCRRKLERHLLWRQAFLQFAQELVHDQ